MSKWPNTFTMRITPIKDAMGTEVIIASDTDGYLQFSKVKIRSMICELPPIEQVKFILNAIEKADNE